jgi:hypothetical protein
MNYQPENGTWAANINQIETTDPVLGGPGGVDNQPLLQLANRTGYLKGIVDSLSATVGGLAPINSPVFTGTPQVPLAAPSDNSAAAASTAFVQRAENGVTTVNTTGGTTTLTADQAALPNFVITGTLTSNATINIPAARVGLMRVLNSTSGAYSVTFKTSTGAGRVLRQGVSRLVYGNGTDVVDGEQSTGTLFVESSLGLSGPATLDNAVFLGAKLASGTSTPLFGLTAANDLIVGSTATTHGNTLFQNNGNTLAQLSAAGLFGVGAAPSYKVHAFTAAANTEIRATTGTAGDAVLTVEAQSAGIGAIALRRATGRLAFSVGGTDQMTLTSAATLAIGGVSHVAALNVSGDIYAAHTGGALLRLADQYGEVRVLSVPDSSLTTSHMDLQAGGATAMRLHANGHLSVGTTTDTGAQLVVSSSVQAASFVGVAGTAIVAAGDGNVTLTMAQTIGSGTSAYARMGTLSAHGLGLMAGGADVARFDASGNFLIGNNAAAWSSTGRVALEVNGASDALIGLKIGGTPKGYLYHDGSTLQLMAQVGYLNFGAGGASGRMTVDVNGAVVAAGTLKALGSSLTLGSLGTNAVIGVNGTNDAYLRGTTISFQNVAASQNLATIDASGNFTALGQVATSGGLFMTGGALNLSASAAATSFDFNASGKAVNFNFRNGAGTALMTIDTGGSVTVGASLFVPNANISAQALFVTGNAGGAEGVQIRNNGGYLSFVNSAGTQRTGYLQGNSGSDVRLISETSTARIGTPAGQISVNSSGVAFTPDGIEIGYKGMPVTTVWANGQCTAITAGFTIPTEAAGNMHGLCNDGSTGLPLTAGSGLQMFKSGSATAVSTLTLQPRGMASVWYRNNNQVYVSGAVQ